MGTSACQVSKKKYQLLVLTSDGSWRPYPDSLCCGHLCPAGSSQTAARFSAQAASGVACACRLRTVSRPGQDCTCERHAALLRRLEQSSHPPLPAAWQVVEDRALRRGLRPLNRTGGRSLLTPVRAALFPKLLRPGFVARRRIRNAWLTVDSKSRLVCMSGEQSYISIHSIPAAPSSVQLGFSILNARFKPKPISRERVPRQPARNIFPPPNCDQQHSILPTQARLVTTFSHKDVV